jgi:CspA family cold shock protein
MHKGIVKWFNNPMKYGFVITDEGKEIFVHFSEIMVEGYKTLKRGDAVQFDLEETSRGLKAVRVIKINVEKTNKNNQNDENDVRHTA